MNDSVISRIVYCIIASISGDLDDIEGRIMDGAIEGKPYEYFDKILFTAEDKALLAMQISEILRDEGYDVLGDLLFETCYNDTLNKTSNALQTLKEDFKKEAENAS
jgi:hypothetical protein